MPHLLLWVPTGDDEYDMELVENSTHARKFLHRLGGATHNDNVDRLEALSKELTEAARKHPLTRWKLFINAGRPVKDRMKAIEDVLRSRLGEAGTKIEYVVIGANLDVYLRGGFGARLAALLSPVTPIVWIKFNL